MSQTVMPRRLMLLAPLGIAVAGGAGFYALLGRMREGTYDPKGIPSPLIGKPVPAFTLPAQPGSEGFSTADLRAAGRPVLVNFFASWCVPCVVEAPQLDTLKTEGVAIWGVAYKDRADATARFLETHGNPYARVARDEPGQVAIDFGLYGVPETFFIDRTGVIRWRWAGPLTDDVVEQDLRPLLKTYA
jgi:cytochrome c biogenesis protein CcmG/thiol:disulfide interchange protein DsbE